MKDLVRKPGTAVRVRVKDIGVVVAWALLAALVLRTFVIGAYRIPSASMATTLMPGDFLVVYKLPYGPATPAVLPLTAFRIPRLHLPSLLDPSRGDVLAVELPTRTAGSSSVSPKLVVKRCVGLPGDTVIVEGRLVIVNGQMLPSPPGVLAGIPVSSGPFVIPARGDEIELGPDLDDAWAALITAEGHMVTRDRTGQVSVDGVPTTLYRVERDYFFLLGDNRSESLDSRATGAVPREAIVGKALLIYWSWDPAQQGSGVFSRLAAIRWSRIGMFVR